MLLRILLVAAACLITAGVSLVSIPAGFICAGVLLAALSVLLFLEVGP